MVDTSGCTGVPPALPGPCRKMTRKELEQLGDRLAHEFAQIVPPLDKDLPHRDIALVRCVPDRGLILTLYWDNDEEVRARIDIFHRCGWSCDDDCNTAWENSFEEGSSDGSLTERRETITKAVIKRLVVYERDLEDDEPSDEPAPAPVTTPTPAEPEKTSSNGWPSS